MSLPLESALVTGAAHGLGAAIAAALIGAGFNVALGDIDVTSASALAKDLDPSGLRAVAIDLDVTEESAFIRAFDVMSTKWGSVEVLVNNAALSRTKSVFDITPAEFDEICAVNLRGAFVGSRVFGAHFKAAGYGRIINLASLAGQNGGSATGAHYAASKGGVITLTKVFARDLAAHGVTVNAIAPGPLGLPSVRALLPPELLQKVISTIPVGALGDATFVGELVALLASRRAAFVTGATWDVNGGLNLR